MALAGLGALGHALKARNQLALDGARIEDPESGEVIDAEHCPLMRKALLAQGVELSQLSPRPPSEFAGGGATAEMAEARYESFEKMRQELLSVVLETRRELRSRAEAKRRARASLEEDSEASTASLGLENPEDLLRREQEHMQRVLEAAHRRIENQKTMEKEHEMRAQEMIAESAKFNEELQAKKQQFEKEIERKRYSTELARQARNLRREEQDEAELQESRRLDEVRAQKTINFEEQVEARKSEVQEKGLKFQRKRAQKLAKIRSINADKEAKRRQIADETEARLDASEKHRTAALELRQTTLALKNEQERSSARERIRQNRAAEEEQREAKVSLGRRPLAHPLLSLDCAAHTDAPRCAPGRAAQRALGGGSLSRGAHQSGEGGGETRCHWWHLGCTLPRVPAMLVRTGATGAEGGGAEAGGGCGGAAGGGTGCDDGGQDAAAGGARGA